MWPLASTISITQELLRNAPLPAPALPNQMGMPTGSRVPQKSASVPSPLTPFMEQMARLRSRVGRACPESHSVTLESQDQG